MLWVDETTLEKDPFTLWEEKTLKGKEQTYKCCILVGNVFGFILFAAIVFVEG